MTTPKYPDVTVQLTGEDGNAWAVLGKTARAMKRAGLPKEVVDAYIDEAMAGDYDHLLGTTMKWVDVT